MAIEFGPGSVAEGSVGGGCILTGHTMLRFDDIDTEQDVGLSAGTADLEPSLRCG